MLAFARGKARMLPATPSIVNIQMIEPLLVQAGHFLYLFGIIWSEVPGFGVIPGEINQEVLILDRVEGIPGAGAVHSINN